MINLDDISVDSPIRLQMLFAMSHLFSNNARRQSLPLRIKLDVKSQHVKAFSDATELHNTEHIACVGFVISTYRLVLLVLTVEAD